MPRRRAPSPADAQLFGWAVFALVAFIVQAGIRGVVSKDDAVVSLVWDAGVPVDAGGLLIPTAWRPDGVLFGGADWVWHADVKGRLVVEVVPGTGSGEFVINAKDISTGLSTWLQLLCTNSGEHYLADWTVGTRLVVSVDDAECERKPVVLVGERP